MRLRIVEKANWVTYVRLHLAAVLPRPIMVKLGACFARRKTEVMEKKGETGENRRKMRLAEQQSMFYVSCSKNVLEKYVLEKYVLKK